MLSILKLLGVSVRGVTGTVIAWSSMSMMSMLLVAGASVVAPTNAHALPIETAYTLNSDITGLTPTGSNISILAIPGSELLDGITIGPEPTPGQCLAGTCDSRFQDWVVFRVSVLSGNLQTVTLTLLDSFTSGLPALGLGYFREDGPVQDGTGLTDLYTGNISPADVPEFIFTANGGGGITGTTLALFVAYADNSLPQAPTDFGFLGSGAVNFMVSPINGAIDDDNGRFATAITIVPEPGTAVLLGLGIAMLSARKTARRLNIRI